MLEILLPLFLGTIGALAAMFIGRPILSFLNLRAAIEAERIVVERLPFAPHRRLVGVYDGAIKDPAIEVRSSREGLRELADRISVFRRTEPMAAVIGLFFDFAAIQNAIESLSANVDGARRAQADAALRKVIRVRQ